jgi:hypothetical protein
MMTVVVVVVTVVSVVAPVPETVMLMMPMEVGSQLAERHWRGLPMGCVHTTLLARKAPKLTVVVVVVTCPALRRPVEAGSPLPPLTAPAHATGRARNKQNREREKTHSRVCLLHFLRWLYCFD